MDDRIQRFINLACIIGVIWFFAAVINWYKREDK